MENLRDHTLAWLDSIGADGLMAQDASLFWDKKHLETAVRDAWLFQLVPAFCHADGSYHAYREAPCTHCDYNCEESNKAKSCPLYIQWLAHKGTK